MPGLTAAIAVVRLANILLVHIDAHVPEVLEAVVHRHPLRGPALAYKNENKTVSTLIRDEKLDREKLTLDPDGELVFPRPCTVPGSGRWYYLVIVSDL